MLMMYTFPPPCCAGVPLGSLVLRLDRFEIDHVFANQKATVIVDNPIMSLSVGMRGTQRNARELTRSLASCFDLLQVASSLASWLDLTLRAVYLEKEDAVFGYLTFDGEVGPLDSNSSQNLAVLENVFARATSCGGASQAYALKFVHAVAFTNPVACKSVTGPDILRTTVQAGSR